MGVHKVEEGGVVIGRGVVFGGVVISLLVLDDYVSVELKLGIGGAGGSLVGAVVRGSLRQIWRGEGKVEFKVMVDGGEFWGTVRLVMLAYVVMVVHGKEGLLGVVTCVMSLSPWVGCAREIEMKIRGKKKKKRGWKEERE